MNDTTAVNEEIEKSPARSDGAVQAGDSTPLQPMQEKPGPQRTRPSPDMAPVDVRLAQALDILDKQYRLYSWNDAKALSLITTDSVLFAAVGFLFAACLSDNLALLLLGLALLLLSLSLFVVLRQVIPQGSSGKSGEAANIRSLRGICSFPNWTTYRDRFCDYTTDQFAEDAIRQAYGMADNNDQSRKTISRGVALTLAGIVALICAATAAALSARDIHLIGTWSDAPAQEQAQSPTTIQSSGDLDSEGESFASEREMPEHEVELPEE